MKRLNLRTLISQLTYSIVLILLASPPTLAQDVPPPDPDPGLYIGFEEGTRSDKFLLYNTQNASGHAVPWDNTVTGAYYFAESLDWFTDDDAAQRADGRDLNINATSVRGRGLAAFHAAVHERGTLADLTYSFGSPNLGDDAERTDDDPGDWYTTETDAGITETRFYRGGRFELRFHNEVILSGPFSTAQAVLHYNTPNDLRDDEIVAYSDWIPKDQIEAFGIGELLLQAMSDRGIRVDAGIMAFAELEFIADASYGYGGSQDPDRRVGGYYSAGDLRIIFHEPFGGFERWAVDYEWGDYDADGDLDLALLASDENLHLFQNAGDGTFAHLDTGIGGHGAGLGELTWSDFDGDGYLDLAVSVQAVRNDAATMATRVYRYAPGTDRFTLLQELGPVLGKLVAFDYDLDGDQDLLVLGNQGSQRVAVLYANQAGTFTADAAATAEITHHISLLGKDQVDAADYDGDGDLDLAFSGLLRDGEPRLGTWLYRNQDGVFEHDAQATDQLGNGQTTGGGALFGDLNADGYPDLLVAGSRSDPGPGTSEYYNEFFLNIPAPAADGRTFAPPTAQGSLPQLSTGARALGDVDNDGYLDVLYYGQEISSPNDIGVSTFDPARERFVTAGTGPYDLNANYDDGIPTPLALGDADADGRLDLFFSGLTPPFRQAGATVPADTRPTTPTNLRSARIGDRVILSWDAATDAQTPASGLTYNVYVGTAPGAFDVVPPLSIVGGANDGYRQVVDEGNAGGRTTYALALPAGDYYWGVQAVDNAFTGSPFATGMVSATEVPLTEVTTSLPALRSGDAAFGDYDGPGGQGDGDLDLALNGAFDVGELHQNLLDRGTPFNFSLDPASTQIAGLQSSDVEWFDCDNDNVIDLFVRGERNDQTPALFCYLNQGDGTFTETDAGIDGAGRYGEVLMFDYDLDGDQDVLLVGIAPPGNTRFVKLNRSMLAEEGQSRYQVVDNTGLPRVINAVLAAVPLGGTMHLAYGGHGLPPHDRVLDVYRYNPDSRTDPGVPAFTALQAGLEGIDRGAAIWVDVVGSSHPDLVTTGSTDANRAETAVYETVHGPNDAFTFTAVPADDTGLPGVFNGDVAFADFNGDGAFDLVLSGDQTVSGSSDDYLTDVYLHNNGAAGVPLFRAAGTDLPAHFAYNIAAGDLDNDGDPDLALAHWRGGSLAQPVRVFSNDLLQLRMAAKTSGTMQAPSAPSGLAAAVRKDGVVHLSWDPVAVPSATYNVYVGTTPGGTDVVSPMASLDTGRRNVAALGNAGADPGLNLVGLNPSRTYYWGVQAIGTSLTGSPFATGTFEVPGDGEKKPVPFFPEVGSPIVPPGSLFPVAIRIGTEAIPAQDVFGVSFRLGYDPDVFDYASSNPGGFFEGDASVPDLVTFSEVDEQAGFVAATISKKGNAPGIDGHGTIAIVILRAAASFDIDKTTISLLGASAIAPDGTDVPLDLTDADIDIDLSSVLVWPGDTNNNGIVNQNDLLPIGAFFDQEGPVRKDTGLGWAAHLAQQWPELAATFADANGDGRVHEADVLGIGLNWGRMRSGRPTPGTGSGTGSGKTTGKPAAVLPLGALAAGTSFSVEVALGEAMALRGLGATLHMPQGVRFTAAHPAPALDDGDLLRMEQAGEGGTLGLAFTRKGRGNLAQIHGTILTFDLEAVASIPEGAVLALYDVALGGVEGSLAPPVVLRWHQATGVGDEQPVSFGLAAAYPNPFNPQTQIGFDVAETQAIRIAVYDALGRQVRVLVDGVRPPGRYTATFEAGGLPSGLYFVRMATDGFTATRRVLLLK